MIRGLKRFLSHWQNLLGLAIVGAYFLVAVAAPWLSVPDDLDHPSSYKIVGRSTDWTPTHPARTLPWARWAARRTSSTLVWGSRSALRFGLITALSTAVLGVLVGAVSGYFGGMVNRLVMRITDAILTFPIIAGVWLFQQILLPPRGGDLSQTWLQSTAFNLKLDPVMLTFILFSWMSYARIINTNVVQLRQIEYVVAAKSLGAGTPRIILRHLLPNSLAPALVMIARDVGAMVILESAFTFIGMGGSTEWGVLLVSGRDYIIGIGGNPLTYWWTFVPASVILALFGVGWNLLGDGLNAHLNPRTQ